MMSEFNEFRRQRQFRWGDPGDGGLPRQVPYIPGDSGLVREGDWNANRKQGVPDAAGYGWLRPSPHTPLEEDE